MTKQKKQRKKAYRPKAVNPMAAFQALDSIHVAAEDHRPLHEDDATDLALAYRLSLETMVKGKSTEEDWSVVVCSLNIGLILCERGIGAEYEPLFVRALDGAFRSRIRAGRTGTWRFDGDALVAIREAIDVHDEQVKITTKEEIRTALLEVHHRIKAGNVYREAA